jgi:5-methyltetrahydropteroyltriglutamate--homocysteine methyltransferase
MNGKTLITGFPRIGEKRELKKALESYWSGKSSVSELEKTAAELRKKHWLIQKNKGIDFISCNDFSLYDNMLDTIVMLNAIPERFKKLENKTDIYFAMARGYDKGAAMEMTKWFNTNYHYIVPELDKTIEFSLDSTKIISEYNEAKSLGINPKINLIGPVTFLGLSKTTDGNDTYDYFEKIIKVYEELLRRLSALDKEIYVQMEEPVFVKDPSVKQLELLGITYNRLGKISPDIKIIVTTYFEHSNEATAVLSKTPVWGLGLDFVHGADNTKSLDYIKDKKLIAGVVDGRNIWINDIDKTVNLLNTISQKVKKEQIIISTSCSLLHVPFTITDEKENEINKWISFASEKADEIVLAGKLFASPDKLTEADKYQLDKNRTAVKERKSSGVITNLTDLEMIKNINKT